MRRYPDRVRTAILDGVVPAEVALGPDVAIEAQRAIDSTLQRCARDAACARSFPTSPRSSQRCRRGCSKEPVKLSIPHPLTARSSNTTLDGARGSVLRFDC